MNAKEILAALSTEEKASLVTGVGNDYAPALERFGIPAKCMRDASHGIRLPKEHNTALFPCLTALTSSFNTECAEDMGRAIADECMHHDVTTILGPGMNIKRYILCGRNFEYMSEDPIVAGEIAAGYVRGLQEKGVSGCIKHYACNNQERDRLDGGCEVDERTLREIYLKPFQVAVEKSNPHSVMCSYNKINGVWASENPFLYDVLKNEWGYEGLVMSDWGAVHDICRSLMSGLDLEMPENKNAKEQVLGGLADGRLTMEKLDAAVLRVLDFILRPIPKTDEKYDRDLQHKRAAEIAKESIVLLKNDRDLLPLKKDKCKKITVVGEYATRPLISGQGSCEVYPADEYVDSPLEELKKRLPDCEFQYLEYYHKAALPENMLFTQKYRMMEKLWGSDAVIVFVGGMEGEDTEDSDRRYGGINQHQELFIRAAVRANKNTIVVLQSGSGMVLEDWHREIPAIVEMWIGGEAAGSAIADVLTGNTVPSGKLAETFPTKLRGDLEYPGDGLKTDYRENLEVGYRYYDKHPEEVIFPFGHGLSYSKFEYSDLAISEDEKNINLTFNIKNVGEYDAKEVYQIYISDPVSTVVRPKKELKGFGKPMIKAGESVTVNHSIPKSELAYYNIMLRKWIIEDGKFNILVGSSSRDIHLKGSITVEGTAPYTLWRDPSCANFIGGIETT